MSEILPEELVASISQQWPCRQLQIRQLSTLLLPALPFPPAIVVHGPEASGKSTILREVLNAYTRTDTNNSTVSTSNGNKRRRIENRSVIDASCDSLHYAVIKVAECITARHLLTRIVSSTIAALRSANNADEEWTRVVNNVKCDHISTLPEILEEILDKAGCIKFVLVLDGVDNLREGGQMLLSALARIGELVHSLCTIFVLRPSPRPLFLQITGVPHVYFPSYTRNEAISIITASGPPNVPGLAAETASKLFGSFVSTLYDALIGPTAGTVPAFRSTCNTIWPRFVLPIVTGENPPGTGENKQWDFAKLLVKNRTLFQQQGEQALVHHIAAEEPTQSPATVPNGAPKTTAKRSTSLPSLPYLSNLILTAAFLAAHTPPRMDIVFFSKFTTSKNKRIRRRKRRVGDIDDPTATPSKNSKKAGQTSNTLTIPNSRGGGLTTGILTPKPFPIERLLAIYHAIDPNPPMNKALPFADAVYPELATLQRLKLLVPASASAAATGAALDSVEKWCLNVNVAVGAGTSSSGEWIVDLARNVGVDIDEYITALVE